MVATEGDFAEVDPAGEDLRGFRSPAVESALVEDGETHVSLQVPLARDRLGTGSSPLVVR